MNYDYLLPIFVGHPFGSEATDTLRSAIQLVCKAANKAQTGPKRYVWEPRFLSELDHTQPENLLGRISSEIEQSALALFDITDVSRINVFLELGVALGQNRSLALLMRKPFTPPADLRGLRGIEYTEEVDLQVRLRQLLDARLAELSRSPAEGQCVIHQKIQIDSTWQHRLQTASHSVSFFAGDVSWAGTYADALEKARARGVTLRACCRQPDEDEEVKWANIRTLKDLGCSVRLVGSAMDPRVRGFIVDAEDMNQNTEALIVEKRTRIGGRTDYERSGATVGESEFLYRGRVFRYSEESRLVAALSRLFMATWDAHCVKPL